jgi:ABC-2 type transport system permease protein
MDLALFRDVVASEWTKLRSVRSTYWSLLVSVLVGIGLSAAIAAGNAHEYKHMDLSDKLQFDPTAFSTAGLFFAQLALGVLAILVVSSEYSTGTIRTTLAAVPQRGYVLAAKTLLVGLVSLLLALAIAFAGFFICQPIFTSYNIPLDFSIHAPHVLRALFGSGLYIGALVLFATGLALIIRHTAGAITTLVGVVFILPIISGLLPDVWQRDFSRFLPANAGSAVTFTVHMPNTLGPWAGYAVLLGWAALSLGVGWWLLRTRDV